jgi:hypothetical protein
MQNEPKGVQTSTVPQPQNQTIHQMQNEPKQVQSSTAPQPQNQTTQTPMATRSGAIPPQQPTRWPNALSRTHHATANQITANQTTANQTTANQTPANRTTGNQTSANQTTPTETATNPQQPTDPDNAHARVRAKAATGEAGRKEAKDREAGDREVKNRETGDDSRRGRHGRQRATITTNAPHSGGESGSRRQDARAYNRLYDYEACGYQFEDTIFLSTERVDAS